MKIVSLATIPCRDVMTTLESLRYQADIVCVNYNFSQLSNQMFGDASKFLPFANFFDGLETEEEIYCFSCDDDLIYPSNYCQVMIDAIEKYNRKAIITCHGRTFPPRRITSYYRDKLDGYRCLCDVDQDVRVDSGGTGVMAWHASLMAPAMDMFRAANMADVFVGRYAKRLRIPIICIAHGEGWIRYIDQPEGSTLWEKHCKNDELQTKYWNGDL